MFEDMTPEDGFEVDEDASDRAILHVIWTRSEVGDLATGDPWALLAERYPDDASLKVLALTMLAEQYGTTSPRAWSDLVARAPDSLRAVMPAALALALDHADAEQKPELEKLARPYGEPMPAEDASDTVYAFEQAMLAEGDRRTAKGAPWAEKRAATPVDYATALSGAKERSVPYSTKRAFEVTDRVDHIKFGQGVVIAVSPQRATIIFADATRTLTCA